MPTVGTIGIVAENIAIGLIESQHRHNPSEKTWNSIGPEYSVNPGGAIQNQAK
jgi:hypothetical protein